MSQPIVVYAYSRCSTCRNALSWLRANKIAFEERPIYTQPPSLAELRRMLALQGGELRRLFNTSGLEYRARNLKDALPKMSTDEALALLASDGRLVKRPFLLADKVGLLGFKEEVWAGTLGG
jgi:arsenate reductase (glutaredoxin)